MLPHHSHALRHVTSIIPALQDTWKRNIPSEPRAPSFPELFRGWEVCGDTIDGELMLWDTHSNQGRTRVEEDSGIKLTHPSLWVPRSPLGLHAPGTLSQTAKYFKYQLECIPRDSGAQDSVFRWGESRQQRRAAPGGLRPSVPARKMSITISIHF